jgi:hypothetical protein
MVQLDPEIEARLLADAQAQGISLDEYVQALVEDVAIAEYRTPVSTEEFEAGLVALSEGCEGLPLLPPEAYSRESIYRGS